MTSLLPIPRFTSGVNAPETVTEGEMDFGYVVEFWVHPMSSDNGPVYVPCVVWLDNTWSRIGPHGTLDAARAACARLGAVHDLPVRDESRPARRLLPLEESVVDIEPGDLPGELPDEAWHIDAQTLRPRLDLCRLGGIVAGKCVKREELDGRLAVVDAILKGSRVVQPHLAQRYMATVRWVAEAVHDEFEAADAASVETDEEVGRGHADLIRAEGVTLEQAIEKLKDFVRFLYADLRWTTGELVPDRHERGERALKAGIERLEYFAREAGR